MSLLLKVVLAFGSVYFTYSTVRKSREAARRHRFQVEHNCAEPPVIRNILPCGIERLLRILFFKGDLLDDYFTPLFKRYGSTHKAHELAGTVISTDDPQNTQAVLATKFKDFEVGELRREVFAPLIGKGIFTSDGEAWEHSRALIRPQFSKAQISDLDVAERHMQKIFDALPVDDSGWTSEVDLSKAFVRFTLDTATEFLFGASSDSILGGFSLTPDETGPDSPTARSILMANIRRDIGGDDGPMDFVSAFNTAAQDLGLRWQTLFGLLGRRRFRKARDAVYTFADRYVDKALHPEKGSIQDNLKSESTHERYILLNELAAEIRDPLELRNQLLHVLIGGKDTTAALLSWVFSLLPRHPEVFSRLRSEILSVFGLDGSLEEITFEKLKSISYLQYVIKETLRLYPIVPMNSRTAVRDTILPVGGGPNRDRPIAIMKGDIVMWSPYHMHRREDIWGSDAAEFKPERWENLKSGWFYLPFNGGPRTCLGRE
ncbi:MAG: hypothetical protein M1816_001142 [Peltula sp. TS41687]|nr:MAG: hypothetical protein M1816_001142 [Peltula sp. TS41687]